MKLPCVTYAGDNSLFNSIQSGLISALPQESVEWRRSFGRTTRSVNVEVDFVPFSDDLLMREQDKNILGHPIFHTYWTDCSDVESYKGNVRETLQLWVQNLKQHMKSDWMIVLVETPDAKKSNKLIPRTTVLDKLKNDFGGKHSERCVSLVDPTKTDSRSLESWHLLLSKMRQMIMAAYNKALNRYEEMMRGERERRTDRNWSFCRYFLLQEELARVYELLCLHDEALVQYDELDALFTQFVRNSAAGDVPHWLSNFSQPCDTWEGLYLGRGLDLKLQAKIKDKSISLLEFRNYLFQCQADLLIQLNKPWDLASRALTFLQNTPTELRTLEGTIAKGGLGCWGFLSCLEVIQFLSKFKDSSTTDVHALHTAPLWAYGRDKLKGLGTLCELMPGGKGSSEKLQIVILLVCGMGDDPHSYQEESGKRENDEGQITPMTRLKEALSSPQAFKKHFLDLSEVAISTYKHIGRIRSARLIGRDLAMFYIEEGTLHQASAFLSDQLKTFLAEGWNSLAAHTQTDLVNCYSATGDNEKYLKTCIQLSACPVVNYGTSERIRVFDQFMKALRAIDEDEKPVPISTERIFEIGWMKLISNGPIILGTVLKVELVVESKLPSPIKFDLIQVQLKHTPEKSKRTEKLNSSTSHLLKGRGGADVERKSSSSSNASQHHIRKQSSVNRTHADTNDPNARHTKRHNSMKEESHDECVTDEAENGLINPFSKKLPMEFHLDYKQDKSLSTVYVNCRNPHKALRREDSLGGLENYEKNVVKEDFTDCLVMKDISINPGRNIIHLKTKVSNNGSFMGGQVVLIKDKLEFICDTNLVRAKNLSLEVVNEKTRVFLGRKERELLAGIQQPLILTVKSGSSKVDQGTKIHLKCSKGMVLRFDNEKSDTAESVTNGELKPSAKFNSEIEVESPEIGPFSQTSLQLLAIAELVAQKDASAIEHNVCITSSLLEEPRLDVDLHFIPPFIVSHKLQTANLKKFVQVTVSGLVKRQMELIDPCMNILEKGDPTSIKFLNPAEQKLVVCADQTANYMWELCADYSVQESPVLKAEFSVSYQPFDDSLQDPEQIRFFRSSFDIQNYKTLYAVRSRVEPSKGSEFCRAGSMCHFHIVIQQVGFDDVSVKQKGGGSEGVPVSPLANSIMYEVITDQAMWAVCGRTSGVLSLESDSKQTVMLDVMPLTGGFLPFPSVRLSKYIPAESQHTARESRKGDIVGTASSVPRLEPFSPGQVYNFSKALQVHVLPASHSQADNALIN